MTMLIPIKLNLFCSYGDLSNVLYSRNTYSQNKSRWNKKSHNTGQYGYNNSNSPSRGSGGQRANPLDAIGEPLNKYSSCGSIMHMKFECPDREYLQQLKSPKKLSSNNRNITLFQQGVGSDCIDVFLEETLNCGVLDCGCPDNICGSDWSNHALDSLDHIKRKKVVWTKSSRTFMFNGYESLGLVEFPAMLGSKEINIRTDVISLKIPLLLSNNSMRKSQTTIDFANDSCTMLGEKMNLRFTSSGHYAVCLIKERAIWDISRNFTCFQFH